MYRGHMWRELDGIIDTGLQWGELVLAPHQRVWLGKLSDFLQTSDATRANILQACGSGKTWMEVAMLEASLRAKNALDHPYPDLLIITEDSIKVGVLKTLDQQKMDYALWEKWKKPTDRRLLVASIQTLQRNNHRISKILSQNIPLIIGDEADLYITDKRKGFLANFPEALHIGFSATWLWSDGRSIEDVWGETLHIYPLSQAIHDKVLLRPKYELIESSVSMDALPDASGQYPIEELDRVLMEAEIYVGIVSTYDSLVGYSRRKEYPTIVAVPTTHLVRETARAFRQNYGREFNIRWWTGKETTPETLKKDMRDFEAWEVDVLIICQMGGRGMNLPNARCMLDATCSASSTRVSQLLPRVMRKNWEDPRQKPDCMIVQLFPKTRGSHPMTLMDIFDLESPLDPKNMTHTDQVAARTKMQWDIYDSLPADIRAELHRDLSITKMTHGIQVVESITAYGVDTVYTFWEDGTVDIEGELYAEVEYFMGKFESRSDTSTKVKIRQYGGERKIAKVQDREGNVRFMNLYPLSCLQNYHPPKIDHTTSWYNRAIEHAGKHYYLKSRLVQMLWIRQGRVGIHFEWLETITAKNTDTTQTRPYYALEDLLSAILTNSAPKDVGGFCFREYEWKMYREAGALYKKYVFPEKYIERHFRDSISVVSGVWKDKKIMYATLYREEEAEKKSTFIARLPRLSPDGTLEKNKSTYVNDEYMERVYGRPGKTLVDICRRSKIDSIEALSTSWNICPCFHLAQVQEVFLEQKKRKDFVDSIRNGIVIVEDIEYISASGIADRYGIYYGKIQILIPRVNLRHIVGANIAWGNSRYYLLSDVEQKLKPLLTS